MRAVDLPERLEQLEDLRDLPRQQPVHGVPSRRAVLELAEIATRPPAPRAALGEPQDLARRAVREPISQRPVDQLQQPGLGGRLDTQRDPATQPQRSFPSCNMSRTPISFSASDNLAISASAATSSGSRPAALTPGREAASAFSAPCRATWRSFMIVERSTPARSAASRVVISPRTSATQISYFCDGDKNRLRRRPPPTGPIDLVPAHPDNTSDRVSPSLPDAG